MVQFFDAAAPFAVVPSERSGSARYSRQVALPRFGTAAQQRLSDARVLIIGAGGLGSSVIPALAAYGVGTIGIIDDDRVELSNLHRQLIHGYADVGSPKATSAAAAIAAIDKTTIVQVHRERLTSRIALDLFAGYDLVIDGSDNFPTRYLANDAASISGIPLVWGAVSQYSGQVGVAWAERGPQYRDLFPTPPPVGTVLSCEAGGVLPSVVAVIGSIMTGEAIKILTEIGTPLIGRVTTYDSLSGAFRQLSYERDPSAAPITQLIDYDLFCGASGSEITVEEFAPALGSTQILDVREPWEAAIASLPGSILVPLGSLDAALDGPIPGLDIGQPIVIYCHSGIRSSTAVQILRSHGVTTARSLDGGIDAWSRRIDPAVARY